MINSGTHATTKLGHKVVEEYFNIANVEHYDVILGTPFLRKMGKVLDFRSPGMAQIGNKVIPTWKVSFDESKDTSNNSATKDNIIQSSGAALDREWSQEGGPQEGPPESSPCSSKGKHPHPRMRMRGRSSIPLRGTSGHTRHTKNQTLPGVDTDRCPERLRAALSHDIILRDDDIPQLRKSWDNNITDLVSGIPLKLLPIREVNHKIYLIDPKKHIHYRLPKCPEHFHKELSQKIERYTTAQWWITTVAHQAVDL